VTRTPLAYAVVAAAANVVGALVVALRAKWSTRALDAMIAFAAGFMICVCLTDIFPEAIERAGARGAMAALAGYLLVHLTQHMLAPHFHFGEETHEVTELVGVSALAGLLLHTFVDGVAIASAFHVSAALGTIVFAAIVLHKLPEGFAIASLFMAAGAGRARAVQAGLALGVSTMAGVVATDAAPALDAIGLGLSAGVTLYVAASNLVPEFQGKHDWRPQLAFVGGCIVYFATRMVAGL
jgi:zinc and cadmium transporter